MARLNVLKLSLWSGVRTHEGAPARRISPEMQLRRSVLACLLWENQFYEDGVEIAGRIRDLVPQVGASRVASLAIEGREKMKLRHAPLLVIREMARHKSHRALVSDTLARVIQRADELSEFLAIYWMNGRVALSAQMSRPSLPPKDCSGSGRHPDGRPAILGVITEGECGCTEECRIRKDHLP